jgi:hypothetical protein
MPINKYQLFDVKSLISARRSYYYKSHCIIRTTHRLLLNLILTKIEQYVGL